ncbi:unnamed protein product [Vitrella brassicaformis CCMP3155]|uniref:Uncharacterized protein n=1 Tax=Vitrella brassicaformis (strain CCMP3155) TaxID=1169540 RepID=A0A0G4ESD7_VITBC|nr:unnamed protein product [Vitrella brassicaformis CCMP3155]|eukprot:CEM00596.1 unnamed protein product [Vitrella brassicaformis CCMP3155]
MSRCGMIMKKMSRCQVSSRSSKQHQQHQQQQQHHHHRDHQQQQQQQQEEEEDEQPDPQPQQQQQSLQRQSAWREADADAEREEAQLAENDFPSLSESRNPSPNKKRAHSLPPAQPSQQHEPPSSLSSPAKRRKKDSRRSHRGGKGHDKEAARRDRHRAAEEKGRGVLAPVPVPSSHLPAPSLPSGAMQVEANTQKRGQDVSRESESAGGRSNSPSSSDRADSTVIKRHDTVKHLSKLLVLIALCRSGRPSDQQHLVKSDVGGGDVYATREPFTNEEIKQMTRGEFERKFLLLEQNYRVRVYSVQCGGVNDGYKEKKFRQYFKEVMNPVDNSENTD